MGESSEIAALRAEVEALKSMIASVRSDLDVAARGGDAAGGAVSTGYDTSWAVPPGFLLPGGGGGGIMPFRIEGGKIVDRAFMFGRQFYRGDNVSDDSESGSTSDDIDGMWYIRIQHSSSSSSRRFSLCCDKRHANAEMVGYNSDAVTYIPLYSVVDGAIAADYRGMPVAVLRE